MQGFINSQKQVDILGFMERVGPCPLQPLELVFGKNVSRHLQRLRGKGYIYNITLNKVEYWSLQGYGYFNARAQEVTAWFAARVVEGGGQYMGNVGISPTNVEFAVNPKAGHVIIILSDNSKYVAYIDDLKTSILKFCLKPYKGGNKMREIEIEQRGHSRGSDDNVGSSLEASSEYGKAFSRIKAIQVEKRVTTDPRRLGELDKELQEMKQLINKLSNK